MAIKDTTKNPYIVDRDSNVKVGMSLPFRRGDEEDGWFPTTSTTIEAIKNNITNLLNTNIGERLMQPNLGVNLRNILFEQIDEGTIIQIQDIILDALQIWLPFVDVKDIQIDTNDDSKTIDNNRVRVKIIFNLNKDPNSINSVSIDFSSGINEGTNQGSNTGTY
tara:strand:+ start:30 stop:521 length:492 start_codon:yes stop_codon:yes gene_type:complete